MPGTMEPNTAGRCTCPSCRPGLATCGLCGSVLYDVEQDTLSTTGICRDIGCLRYGMRSVAAPTVLGWEGVTVSFDGDDDDDRDGSSPYVRSYSYKPRPRFYGQGPLFLGMELEMETRRYDRAAQIATDELCDLGYLKEDSSIGFGFELVTHPMDYGYAMEDFPWPMLNRLQKAGAFTRPDDNGLHVHLSRAGFTDPCHTFRWLKFWYRNPRPLTKLARRESHSWGSLRGDGSAEHNRNAKLYAKGWPVQPLRRDVVARHRDPFGDYERPWYPGRYQGINVSNPDTFEVRIFASSLLESEVRGTLALCAATTEYTRTLSTSDIIHNNGWTWPRFVSWLKSSDGTAYQPVLTLMEELCVS